MAKAKKSGKVIGMPTTPENQIRTRARNLGIGDCWITEDWEEMREANVLVTRKHNQGGITFAVYLVDLALLGLKDTFYQFNMPPSEFDDFIKDYTEKECSIKVDYPFAHNLIYGAIAYAEEYDFHPHKDFAVSQYVLEEDSEEIPLIELEFGVDGLPTVFTTAENQRIADIKKMERLVGKGNFMVIDLGEEPDWADLPGNDQDDLVDQDDLADMDDADWDEADEADPILVDAYVNLLVLKEVYRVCGQILLLKPWEKLSETDIFAIKLPGSGKEYFVSVMGSNGEVFALAFYEGERAIYKFFELQNEELNYHPTFLLSIPQIVVSWEEKRELDPLQAHIMDKMGISYTGKNVWPQITRTIPGCMPEIPDIRSFEIIKILLEQSLVMLPRVISDPSIVWGNPDQLNTILFRVPKKVIGEWVWHDKMKTPAPDTALSKVNYNAFQLEEFRNLPVIWKTLQVDIVLQPYPIKGKDGKVNFAFILIAMDPKNDLILFAQVLESEKRYETNLKNLPNLIMDELVAIGGRPAKFEYRNPDLLATLRLFQNIAGIEAVLNRNLEPLGMAVISLIDELGKNVKRGRVPPVT